MGNYELFQKYYQIYGIIAVLSNKEKISQLEIIELFDEYKKLGTELSLHINDDFNDFFEFVKAQQESFELPKTTLGGVSKQKKKNAKKRGLMSKREKNSKMKWAGMQEPDQDLDHEVAGLAGLEGLATTVDAMQDADAVQSVRSNTPTMLEEVVEMDTDADVVEALTNMGSDLDGPFTADNSEALEFYKNPPAAPESGIRKNHHGRVSINRDDDGRYTCPNCKLAFQNRVISKDQVKRCTTAPAIVQHLKGCLIKLNPNP
tara:strand:- start:4271 stop:5050 length:780 start_codon:yes stop_codon:yes gene_type:complete